MVRDLAGHFMIPQAGNKPSTVRENRTTLKVHVLLALGKIKVANVKRSDVVDIIILEMARPPATAAR